MDFDLFSQFTYRFNLFCQLFSYFSSCFVNFLPFFWWNVWLIFVLNVLVIPLFWVRLRFWIFETLFWVSDFIWNLFITFFDLDFFILWSLFWSIFAINIQIHLNFIGLILCFLNSIQLMLILGMMKLFIYHLWRIVIFYFFLLTFRFKLRIESIILMRLGSHLWFFLLI